MYVFLDGIATNHNCHVSLDRLDVCVLDGIATNHNCHISLDKLGACLVLNGIAATIAVLFLGCLQFSKQLLVHLFAFAIWTKRS